MALAAPFPAARSSQRSAPRTPVRSSGRPSTALRLTSRGRALLLLVSVAVLALAILASGRFAAIAGHSADGRPVTSVVVVQPGETLWQIARTIDPGADPRELVSRIRELNGLGAAAVVPGQSLVVPR